MKLSAKEQSAVKGNLRRNRYAHPDAIGVVGSQAAEHSVAQSIEDKPTRELVRQYLVHVYMEEHMRGQRYEAR